MDVLDVLADGVDNRPIGLESVGLLRCLGGDGDGAPLGVNTLPNGERIGS